ncbi:MAG: hypothetical protein ACJARD_001679, partial [Alphaproteobacteria bacterium]
VDDLIFHVDLWYVFNIIDYTFADFANLPFFIEVTINKTFKNAFLT